MKNILLTLLVAVLILPSTALGATIIASQDGNWEDASTWTGGVIPGDGDTALIPTDVTIQAGSTIDVDLISLYSNGTLTVNAGAELWCSGSISAGLQFILVASGSTLTNYGTIGARDASATADDEYLVKVQAGGEIVSQGTSYGKAYVKDVTSSSGNLTITLDRNVPDGSLVRVDNGLRPNAMYPITSTAGNTITLDGGAISDLVQVVSAGADSVEFVDSSLIGEANASGRLLVSGDDIYTIDVAFDRGDNLVAYLDVDTEAGAINLSGQIWVTESIYKGVRLEFIEPAIFYGQETEPNGVGNTQNEGMALFLQGANISASFDMTYFRYISEDNKGITFTSEDQTVTFNKCYFREWHTKYLIDLKDGSDGTGATFTLTNCFARDPLGTVDGDWGHFVNTDEYDLEDTFIFRECAGIGFKDDWIACFSLGALEIYDTWYCGGFSETGIGAENFVDNVIVGGPDVTITDCLIYNTGETALQSDQGGSTWLVTRVKIVNAGNVMGRIDNGLYTDGNTSLANSIGANLVNSSSGVRILTDVEFRWCLSNAVSVSSYFGSTMTFNNCKWINNIRWQDPLGEVTVDPAVSNIGPVIVQGDGVVTFSNCVFRDNPRLAISDAWFQSASTAGMWIRGANYGGGARLAVTVDQCTFDQPQGQLEFVRWNKAYVYADNALCKDITLTNNTFTDGYWAFYNPVNLPGTLTATRNIFDNQADYVFNTSTDGVIYNFNTTYYTGSSRAVVHFSSGATGPTMIGNLLLSSGGYPTVRFVSIADTVGAVMDYNVYTTGYSRNHFTNISDATWQTQYDQRGLMTSSNTSKYLDYVISADLLALVGGSGAHNLIADPTYADSDGTNGDAGAVPRLNPPEPNRGWWDWDRR